MPDHIHFLKTIPLLPDDELLEEFEHEKQQENKGPARVADRSSRRQVNRRLEALKNELKDRGLEGPPWWTT